MRLKRCIIECREDFIKVNIDDIVKSNTIIKKWAYVLHNKDNSVPHYHIYLDFGVLGLDTKQVAGWFGLEEIFVSKVIGRHQDVLLYLSNGRKNRKNKYEYVYTGIKSNFSF